MQYDHEPLHGQTGRLSVALAAALASFFWVVPAVARCAAQDEACLSTLRELERVRDDPRRAGDVAVVIDLAQRAESVSDASVRTEARMLAAETLSRHDFAQARALLEKVVRDADADPTLREYAGSRWVDLAEDAPRAEWKRAIDELPLAGSSRARVRTLIRRWWLHKLALGACAIPVVGVGVGVGGVSRRTLRAAWGAAAALAVSTAALVALGGGLLASIAESARWAPFAWLGVALGANAACARVWSHGGDPRVPVRLLRAAACALAAVAAGFLVLYALGPRYLQSFGL